MAQDCNRRKILLTAFYPQAIFFSEQSKTAVLRETGQRAMLPLPIYAQNGRFVSEADIVKNAAKFQSQIERRPKNQYFQLPVKLNDKTANLDMYILNGGAEKNAETDSLKLYLSLNLSNLGNVSFYVNTENDSVSVLVCAGNETALQALKDCAADIKRYIEDAGFSAENISFKERAEKNIFMSLTQNPAVSPFNDYEFAV